MQEAHRKACEAVGRLALMTTKRRAVPSLMEAAASDLEEAARFIRTALTDNTRAS